MIPQLHCALPVSKPQAHVHVQDPGPGTATCPIKHELHYAKKPVLVSIAPLRDNLEADLDMWRGRNLSMAQFDQQVEAWKASKQFMHTTQVSHGPWGMV